MQISPDQGALLTMLARMHRARAGRIELGTFTGYSAICIARGLGDGGAARRLRARPRAGRDRPRTTSPLAGRRATGSRSGSGRRSTRSTELAEEAARARSTSPSSTPTRTGYAAYYEHCLELLRPGGLIVIDNVLRGGDVLEPGEPDERRHAGRSASSTSGSPPTSGSTIAMLGVADGITLARKR